jgi:hypothetical protein
MQLDEVNRPTRRGRAILAAKGRNVTLKMSTQFPRHWICIAGAAMLLASGCQCCPLFDCYANAIDDINDTHIYFDRCYNPKYDLTRMGKPDWYSRWNRFFCPRCAINGSYDRYDDCTLYPPLYPFEFPSSVMPPPTVRTARVPKVADPDDLPAPSNLSPLPNPGPVSTPTEPE